MPRGDRTGPWGLGPRTGRGMGYCSGYSYPGFMSSWPRLGFGRGFGFGREFGRGMGRGRGWHRAGYGFWGYPYPPMMPYSHPFEAPYGYPDPYNYPYTMGPGYPPQRPAPPKAPKK